MAFEPTAVDGLHEEVAQIYADAEVQLLARIASSLERGIGTPPWVSMQLAEVARLSKEARGFLLSLDPVVSTKIQAALADAHAAGVSAADQDIPGAPATSPAPIVSHDGSGRPRAGGQRRPRQPNPRPQQIAPSPSPSPPFKR